MRPRSCQEGSGRTTCPVRTAGKGGPGSHMPKLPYGEVRQRHVSGGQQEAFG